MWSRLMSSHVSGRRAHSVVGALCAARWATVVPHEPPPITPTLIRIDRTLCPAPSSGWENGSPPWSVWPMRTLPAADQPEPGANRAAGSATDQIAVRDAVGVHGFRRRPVGALPGRGRHGGHTR